MKPFLAATLWAIAVGIASAHNYEIDSLRIEHPFARATPPGAQTGSAFFTIENRGAGPDRLLHASSPVAAATEIHEMAMEGNVMRMRALSTVPVPAKSTVALRPGGIHVMLVDLKKPLTQGDKVPLTLTFEKAGSIKVDLEVESMISTGVEHPH